MCNQVLYSLMLFAFMAFFTACDKTSEPTEQEVTLMLKYPDGLSPQAGVNITITSSEGTVYTSATTADGSAKITLPFGLYNLSVSDKQFVNDLSFYCNATSQITVAQNANSAFEITLNAITPGQIIIKEFYNGGSPKDDGAGVFQHDRYVILYNNTSVEATIDKLCMGMVIPLNAEAGSGEGTTRYENENFIPAGYGIWYAQEPIKIPPYTQKTIALFQAIDHTTTYSQSVNLSKSDYVLYDIEKWNNATYYTAPYAGIASSAYFKAVKWGSGNVWPLSQLSPAFFIYNHETGNPNDLNSNTDWYYINEKVSDANKCAKINREWVLDAIEVFNADKLADCKKRFPATLDAGNIAITSKKGYTAYRNVDKAATEAIEGNATLLVYDYDTTLDPSGIDAEASLKKGAKIVYLDSNNSSADFHQRTKASLRN